MDQKIENFHRGLFVHYLHIEISPINDEQWHFFVSWDLGCHNTWTNHWFIFSFQSTSVWSFFLVILLMQETLKCKELQNQSRNRYQNWKQKSSTSLIKCSFDEAVVGSFAQCPFHGSTWSVFRSHWLLNEMFRSIRLNNDIKVRVIQSLVFS